MSHGAAPPAVLIMGPTTSGKTALALELATHFDVEVISVDSAQVYRGMDIGTAKPAADVLARVPHHLIDILDPTERYSAARFVTDANAAMRDIIGRGRLPLLVGGTMLYFKALQEGLSELPAADPHVRAQIERRAQAHGWPALHAELAQVDPATAQRLEPADAQRIQRALEIFHVAGEPMSALLQRRSRTASPVHMLGVALEPSVRAVLHRRIAERFDAMLELGLIDEVRRLRGAFVLDASLPAMRTVGYRQVWEYLDGRIDLAALREKGIAATRQLAKRQLTWLRAMDAVQRFDCLATDLTAAVIRHLRARVPDAVAR
ncbi:MAG: tRNA (adenosine(37)-N6)-dimethylallyltransferase MiaA [Burkholderiales bacterium]|nr:tRNA (adenosine(37)-N6)-dimethylallyltransferase MiaA [Burkholderiales bacterium]